MMQMTEERLYNLLPAIFRLRDVAEGEPLRALLAVITAELGLVEADIARLYDNWFIETCDEWVVPYIGDLLGVRGLGETMPGAGFSQRAYVANTIAYRRRKGTAAVLEQLARDLTGWPAAAIEFFERLVVTQHMNHPRPDSPATPNLRDAYQLALTGGAFEETTHLADVRGIERGRGKYNIPNVGIFLWPIQPYQLTDVTAHQVSAVDQRRYTFSPLGRDLRLFNLPRTEEAITDRTGPLDVPLALSRRFLKHNLAACYGTGDDAKSLLIKANGQVVPQETILVCDLSDKTAGGWLHTPPVDKVAVDPELGRIAFGTDPAGAVAVSFTYGFPGDLGGGPYNRQASLAAFLADFARAPQRWQIGVRSTPGTQIVATLGEAVQTWNEEPAGTLGIITIMDSHTYQEDLVGPSALKSKEGSRLLLVAADWVAAEDPARPRVPGQIVPTLLRPHVRGAIEVTGTAPTGRIEPGELIINGLLVEGSITVQPGNLGALTLAHTTLVPGAGALTVQANDQLTVSVEHSIVGTLALAETIRTTQIMASIVDGDLNAGQLAIEASTILGATKAVTLAACNSIFVGPVMITRRQSGCVRFCYLPFDSQTPQRYHCQPATAAAAERVTPHFNGVTFGEPTYAQLAATCPTEISRGAEDEGAMGAFHFLQTPHRIQRLRTSLDEYLRVGLAAGVFLVV